MSQDVVGYDRGPAGAEMEGSTDTYVIDVISGHRGPSPNPIGLDVTGFGGAIGRWTLPGRTDLQARRPPRGASAARATAARGEGDERGPPGLR
jgi:hypothetical protein